MEEQRPSVPKTTKQGRDIPPLWDWIEPLVWNDKMLAALERGVKGGKWFSLIDKVWSQSKSRSIQNALTLIACKPSSTKSNQSKEDGLNITNTVTKKRSLM
nr:hypothetical protein [Candidatus Cloacimonadota bacterium]